MGVQEVRATPGGTC